MAWSLVAISLGAAAGAIVRWLLGNLLNALLPAVPLGTLAANLLGGYGIGLALVFFASHPSLAPEWRLLVITGFMGGLTTFSTFSAEVTSLLQDGRFGWAALAALAHVAGSLLMTILGIASAMLWQRA